MASQQFYVEAITDKSTILLSSKKAYELFTLYLSSQHKWALNCEIVSIIAGAPSIDMHQLHVDMHSPK